MKNEVCRNDDGDYFVILDNAWFMLAYTYDLDPIRDYTDKPIAQVQRVGFGIPDIIFDPEAHMKGLKSGFGLKVEGTEFLYHNLVAPVQPNGFSMEGWFLDSADHLIFKCGGMPFYGFNVDEDTGMVDWSIRSRKVLSDTMMDDLNYCKIDPEEYFSIIGEKGVKE